MTGGRGRLGEGPLSVDSTDNGDGHAGGTRWQGEAGRRAIGAAVGRPVARATPMAQPSRGRAAGPLWHGGANRAASRLVILIIIVYYH